MIFSELYSAYYLAVAEVLKAACDHPVGTAEMQEIVRNRAFGESILEIEPALREQRWQLLYPDGTTPVRNVPDMPLTLLEKRWLKAVALDPRVRLFGEGLPEFPGVEPLFHPEDVRVFDRYLDGDPYEGEAYVRNFRLILASVRNGTWLEIRFRNRKGNPIRRVVRPEYLEYSEKDDKFRLISSGVRSGRTLNLARIITCAPAMCPQSGVEETEAEKRQVAADCRQSNHEGDLVDWIQEAYFEKYDGVVMNPGAYTHTSIAIADAVKAIAPVPVVEVHISDINSREEFRHHSFAAPYCLKQIKGHGIHGYIEAMDELIAFHQKG